MTATHTQAVAAAEGQLYDRSAEQTARVLRAAMTVTELRSWMSSEGLVRTRGADKEESSLQAVDQARGLCEAVADAFLREEGRFEARCPSCSFSGRFDEAGGAEEAASAHKSDEPTHFPRAVDQMTGEKLYG
jgi:hypothetical protein